MRIFAYIVLGAALCWAPAAGAAGDAPAASPYGKPPEPASPSPKEPAERPGPAAEASKSTAKAAATKPEPEPVSAPGEIVASLFPFIPPKYIPQIELHGSAYLWFYQPVTNLDLPPLTTNDRFFRLYLASLDFDAKAWDFGFHLNPRFSDAPIRDTYNSNVWVQEVYAYHEREYAKIKVGKIENAFSRLSDDTFNSPLAYYDGIKYDYDYGVSVEGSYKLQSGLGLGYYAQYFYVDGHTNGSTDDRDTVWVTGANRFHIAVLRVEPSYHFSPTTSLRAGVAGQFFLTNFGDKSAPEKVLRFGADFSLSTGPVKVFGEFIGQFGRTVTKYPSLTQTTPDGKVIDAPSPSGQNYYLLGGAELQIWRFLPRYSLSFANYYDATVVELLHIAGVTVTLHEHVSLMLEYVYWPRKDPNQQFARLIDNSFNAVIYAGF